MSSKHTRSMTSDDENWPVLGGGKQATPTAPPKSGGATRTQPAGASGNSVDQPSSFNKSLAVGVDVQRPASGGVNTSLGNSARVAHARPLLKTSEVKGGAISYSDMARRSSPPPSPTLKPTISLPSTTSKTTDTPSNAIKRSSKPSTQPLVADSFPPLSTTPSPAPTNVDKAVPARKGSYAAATGTTATGAKCRPTVLTTGACPTLTAGPSVSESPVTALSPRSSAKVISINIGNARPVSPPPAAPPPAQSPRTPKRRKQASAPDSNTLYPPNMEGRVRSASVSSVATSVAASSVITSSSRGPASSKTSVCQTPISDDLEWPLKLSELAKGMSSSQRAAWEKILRCDPKDTSKMKWNQFDKALRALRFKPQARGGSETEYTPDPEYFGPKAQPISYHRPHPGADFTLGDLKAKSNSFRAQYTAAVAVLHEAWGVMDTRL